MPDSPRSTMRRDIVSAYVVTLARVGSWALVSALVYRQLGRTPFALLVLVRATIGIFSYVSLGVGPALVKLLTAVSSNPPLSVIPVNEAEASEVLSYAGPVRADYITRAYFTAEKLVVALGAIGFVFAMAYSIYFPELHVIASQADRGEAITLAMLFSAGIICRFVSEAPSGMLLALGRIELDNYFLAGADLLWVLGCTLTMSQFGGKQLYEVGGWFWLSNVVLLICRGLAARLEARRLSQRAVPPDWSIARQLIGIGSLIVLASLADFLYAPTDCILIDRLINASAVAWYSPAMQIDAGLLLLVAALATVLYPKTAIAHGAGDMRTIRHYYIRGTLASGAILLLAGLSVWAISPWMFKFWFGDDLPMTRAILPLMLIHTIVGGSSAVGRSILLGIGKFKAFTISVLLAGVSNVILSFVFVKYFNLGLKGIVFGTIVAVVGRCAIWMPWYVLRTLREETFRGERSAAQ